MIRYLTKYPEVFDPETVRMLSDALEDTWEIASANQITHGVGGDPEAARDLVAKHIVDIALQGERNRQRLILGALDRLKR